MVVEASLRARLQVVRRRADFAHHDRCKEIRKTHLKLSLYSFKFDPIDCLRHLLLEFFDILDGCLCYSTKLYGGTKAQCQAFAEVMNLGCAN